MGCSSSQDKGIKTSPAAPVANGPSPAPKETQAAAPVNTHPEVETKRDPPPEDEKKKKKGEGVGRVSSADKMSEMVGATVPSEASWQVNPLQLKKLKKLGKGSSGDVVLASSSNGEGNGKEVALKIVPITLKKEDIDPVLNQLRDLYDSRHPNVTAFHGAAYDAEICCICIAFEHMDLKSLKDLLLVVKKLPEDVMGNCTLQVVRALRYLHSERKIMHRDIKPNNVLVSTQGVFKISDFGMSKELSNTLAAGQTWVGTSSYMSPERVGGLDYTFNADIWSLGLVVFECSTAEKPYGGQNTFELLDQIVDGNPPSLPQGLFSNEARDFVSLCLKKSHNERPDCDFLITHPFLKKYKDTDVKAWLSLQDLSSLRG